MTLFLPKKGPVLPRAASDAEPPAAQAAPAFLPEGARPPYGPFTRGQLARAAGSGVLLESRALWCDAARTLHFDLGACAGELPFAECCLEARAGEARAAAALSRVGRMTCFAVQSVPAEEGAPALLSRAAAQAACRAQYLDALVPGDILPCRVTHLERYGAFCDVGCGVTALLPIDCMSVSRIAHPSQRVSEGEVLHCAVKMRDARGRLVLTMKELLGTWEENAAHLHPGDVAVGVVRSRESYGVFIELAPNLAGLAEPDTAAQPGQTVSVYIKGIVPERMKVKLAVLHVLPGPPLRFAAACAPAAGHLDRWVYSPPQCPRVVETVFSDGQDG